jgi:hypothetical protein
MPTASYIPVAGSREVLVKAINAGTDQWAIALSNAVPGLTFTAGTTDLATGGGYTQGGNNVATTSSAEAAGVWRLILVDPTAWTATGGGFTARYVLLVNKTTNQVPGYWDYGLSQAVAAAETFVADLDGTNGVITVT